MIALAICWCLFVDVAAPYTRLIYCDSWVILLWYLCFKWCRLLCSTFSLCLLSSMGYSCVIIVVLGVITLGGVTVSVTLGGGTITGTLLGTIVGT